MGKIYLCLMFALARAQAFAVAEESVRIKRNDDVSTEMLHAMVQQQAQTIQTLQAQVEALNNMRNDVIYLKNRINTTSYAVGFTVRSTHDPISVGQHGIVPFNQIVTSVGGGFNTQTGVFTSPIPGLYAFFLTSMAQTQQPAVALAFDRQGTELEFIWIDGNIVSQDQAASQVTTHMAAGEQMSIRHHSGSTVIRGSIHTVFTGFLLQAD